MDQAMADAAPLVDAQRRTIDYLRVSVTDRCNYRCTYCMPEDGVDHMDRADILSFEELCALLGCFASLGVRRVRLTGGEPTVRRDLVALVQMIRAVPGIDEIALSTNGHLLADMAVALKQAGVDRLNVSLDTLDAERFAAITRRGQLDRVLGGIEAARVAGFSSIKINTVAVKGFNDHELASLCAYAWERGLIPRFIEQMPMAGGRTFIPGELLSAAEIRAAIVESFPGNTLIPDEGGGVRGAGPARYWRLAGATVEGQNDTAGARRLGIISPMTEHFCASCNRVRLSAGGALHTCLAYDDAVDLRELLRTQGPPAVVSAIRAAVSVKREGHQFGLLGLGGPRKAMVQIGG
jgi:cyclic pyranopterin phosphate synthase